MTNDKKITIPKGKGNPRYMTGVVTEQPSKPRVIMPNDPQHVSRKGNNAPRMSPKKDQISMLSYDLKRAEAKIEVLSRDLIATNTTLAILVVFMIGWLVLWFCGVW